MKKLFITIICVLLLCGCNDKKVDETKDNSNGETKEETKVLDETTHYGKIVSTLQNYGITLYENNDYLTFSLENNTYFISLKELNVKYNFDLTEYNASKCNIEKSGIYFDIERKVLTDQNITYPIYTKLIECTDEIK